MVVTGIVSLSKAYFSDTELSLGNKISMGTVNLQVGDHDPSTFSFEFSNIAPGEMWQTYAAVKTIGSLSGNFWFDVATSNSQEGDNPEAETDTEGEGDLENCTELRIVFYNDSTGEEFELFDFTPIGDLVGGHEEHSGSDVDALVESNLAIMNLQARMDNCGNEAMGDSFDLDLAFHLQQV